MGNLRRAKKKMMRSLKIDCKRTIDAGGESKKVSTICEYKIQAARER